MALRLASITLPLFDNRGDDLTFVHDALQIELLDVFGGYTALSAVGAWRSSDGRTYRDENVVYQIAVSDGQAYPVNMLRTLAKRYGELACQDAMFITLPSGNCEILNTKVPTGVA